MTTSSDKKLKILLERHKPGTVCLASWLTAQGISRDLQQYYTRSGWLESVGRGAFKRPGDKVDWRGGVFALQQQADLAVHVGGITALSMRGFSHYLRLGGEKVYLFSPVGTSLPAWFKKYHWGVDIEHARTNFLPKVKKQEISIEAQLSVKDGLVGNDTSSPERAILECLYLAPNKQDLMECFLAMHSLVNLRPRLVQLLLENCTSIKVKRLFLYMAEKSEHQWLQFVDLSNIDIGKGDRSIVKGGVYIAKYRISIPRELASL